MPVRRAIGIPDDATHFVWSYPIVGGSRLSFTTPVGSFMNIGGYVYVNESNQFRAATTLVPANEGALQFGDPQKWKLEWTRELHKFGRFQPITIPQLQDTGAKYFCWLRPGEQIPGGPANRHGGFVYLFHDNVIEEDPALTSYDRFFAVLGGEDENYDTDVLEQPRGAAPDDVAHVGFAQPTPSTPSL